MCRVCFVTLLFLLIVIIFFSCFATKTNAVDWCLLKGAWGTMRQAQLPRWHRANHFWHLVRLPRQLGPAPTPQCFSSLLKEYLPSSCGGLQVFSIHANARGGVTLQRGRVGCSLAPPGPCSSSVVDALWMRYVVSVSLALFRPLHRYAGVWHHGDCASMDVQTVPTWMSGQGPRPSVITYDLWHLYGWCFSSFLIRTILRPRKEIRPPHFRVLGFGLHETSLGAEWGIFCEGIGTGLAKDRHVARGAPQRAFRGFFHTLRLVYKNPPLLYGTSAYVTRCGARAGAAWGCVTSLTKQT